MYVALPFLNECARRCHNTLEWLSNLNVRYRASRNKWEKTTMLIWDIEIPSQNRVKKKLHVILMWSNIVWLLIWVILNGTPLRTFWYRPFSFASTGTACKIIDIHPKLLRIMCVKVLQQMGSFSHLVPCCTYYNPPCASWAARRGKEGHLWWVNSNRL